MILSFWRRTHLVLALVASIFLIITSVTGVILSFDPISSELSDHHIPRAEETSVADVISVLNKKYLEVIEVKVNQQEFLEVSVITNEGDFETFYADPKTGEKSGEIAEESSIFAFSRTLHRSLFLGDLGRITIGIVAFLLLLISLSGALLVIKRQLSIKHFFSKVIRDNFHQYWHVVLGRISLVVIVLISLTGTFLSMNRFGMLPEQKTVIQSFETPTGAESTQSSASDFDLFKQTKLSELESIQFPFSPDPEDYFLLTLHNEELTVNQFNGEIIKKKSFGTMHGLEQLSFNLHTGKGSLLWSIILGLACISILFFILSGFKMTLKRLKGKPKNRFSKDTSEIIILVGSEGGKTLQLAQQFQQILIESGQKVYLTEMNRYERYPKMEQLIIFTSTYGNGEAPTNAKKFVERFETSSPNRSFSFSVVGFGSTNYRQFCRYAEVVHALLNTSECSSPLLPLFKIDKGSFEELSAWIEQWSTASEIRLRSKLKRPTNESHPAQETFEVITNTKASEDANFTFLLTLKNNNRDFKSGDLIAIQHAQHEEERFYSIGTNITGDLLLCIRKHPHGQCSSYLSELQPGNTVNGRIQSNPSFHFPQKESSVIAICNGTGIAPFLGMAHEKNSESEFHILWGGKSRNVLQIVEPHLKELLSDGKINSFTAVFSAEPEEESRYVQSLIKEREREIADAMSQGAIIMICGSINMSLEVISELDTIVQLYNNQSISYYEKNNQIKTDCY